MGTMTGPPSGHGPRRWRAVPEERMTTRSAEIEGASNRLRANMEQLWMDMARRDKDNLRWEVGLWITTAVVLGILIRRPA